MCMCARVSVCGRVCVRARERERVCVCVSARAGTHIWCGCLYVCVGGGRLCLELLRERTGTINLYALF